MVPAMPAAATLTIALPDEAATEALGQALAAAARPGDTILLEGPIGAGKSHLARAFLRSRTGDPTAEVPSPTFTLVQTYADAGGGTIWHADLYRLSGTADLDELGLDEAFGRDICLVEWPDRLGGAAPPDALRLRLSVAGEGRQADLTGGRAAVLAALGPEAVGRASAMEHLLRSAGWAGAHRTPLAGDASARRYLRLSRPQGTAVLMDAPPGQADDPAAFVRIARHLSAIGLSPPRVLAQDLAAGFVLLEDLGDGVFARLCAADPGREPGLYAAAVDMLVHLQRHPAPPGLPDASAADWAEAAMLALSHYAGDPGGAARAELSAALAEALRNHADGPRCMILRDCHAENLIWLPDRAGVARVGLLDFQLAQMGQPGYDLVSLLQDARRDLAPGLEAAMRTRFADLTGAGEGFGAAYATLGAQRALRILGIFARLCTEAGKPGYLALVPRVWGHLQVCLSHPALAALAGLCARLLPPPDPATLARIAARCPTPPPVR